jgi:F0F1-type ATP synthase membrane subunit b/b'|tara:strand:- start:150 stop:320 length:171 start_codon:yes stop_codon:yes gene_type:complete
VCVNKPDLSGEVDNLKYDKKQLQKAQTQCEANLTEYKKEVSTAVAKFKAYAADHKK